MTPQLRFPEFTDRWQTKRVSSLFEITRGLVLAIDKTKPKRNHENIYPVYSSQTKHNGLMGYYSDYLYEDAITWTTDGANAGEVQYRQGKFYCTNVCGVLKSNRGYANKTIAELLNRITHKYVSYVGNPKLMNNVMGSISINIPSVKEQEKIAEFLTAVDGRIGKIEKKLELLQRYKKGVMQKIFTQQIRFKDENGNPYPEWEERRLGNIGTLHRGLSYNKSNVKDDESLNLVMRSNNIQDGHLDYGNDLQFVDKGVTADLILIKGDIAICMANGSRRLVGKSAVYDGGYKVGHILTVGAFCSIFRSRNVLAKFLFQTDTYKKGIDLLLAGTNINNLKNSDLASIRFSIPSEYEEQQKIASFLTALDNRIKAEQTRLTAAKQWKKGLLQRMFT